MVMAKKKADPLVMELLIALERLSRGRPAQWWIGVAELGIDPEQLEETLTRAEEQGLVSLGGKPAHSAVITQAGRNLVG
jgi:hypothetical protein